MSSSRLVRATTAALFALLVASWGSVYADGNLHNLNHIIVVMQENHSFDNYLGALPYAAGTPYHAGNGACRSNDNTCVDGLRCTRNLAGNYTCTNSNLEDDGSPAAFAFHDPRYCTGPDLQHNWPGSHMEANFNNPAGALNFSPNDGFVRVNDAQEQHDTDTGESPTDDDTMGFYNETDLPFYYALAESFAIDDRYFCSVVGPTFPNRAYELAATSFGHLTTAEIFPPPQGYKPITGTIFDLLDQFGVAWVNYFSDLPTSFIFRFPNPRVKSISDFLSDAAAGTLPPVSFVDPSFMPDQIINGLTFETDEHPPNDIRAGQYFVSQIVNAVRNGPNWKDSIVFITYDEHGGFFDHVAPPAAPQGGALNPDGINPGQCEDLSNPPASQQPGGGAQCTISASDAAAICPGFTATGPYPANCANFNQLGFRVPFIAVSPFSKPHYVSHTIGDHTSLLALIEKRFISLDNNLPKRPHLTARDLNASTLLDMFDFNVAPSMNTSVPTAPLPTASDPGCSPSGAFVDG
jgi:phospholipase C